MAEPVMPDAPAPPEPAAPLPAPLGLPALPELAGVAGGAGLCFAEPIAAGGRMIVPVARVRTWRGHTDTRAVGALEVGDDGVRLRRFDDDDRPARLRAMTAGLLTGVALGLAARRPTRARRPAWRR